MGACCPPPPLPHAFAFVLLPPYGICRRVPGCRPRPCGRGRLSRVAEPLVRFAFLRSDFEPGSSSAARSALPVEVRGRRRRTQGHSFFLPSPQGCLTRSAAAALLRVAVAAAAHLEVTRVSLSLSLPSRSSSNPLFGAVLFGAATSSALIAGPISVRNLLHDLLRRHSHLGSLPPALHVCRWRRR